VQDELENRLRNWGAWSRSGLGAKGSSSPLYRLMVEAGTLRISAGGVQSCNDLKDALRLEKAITAANLLDFQRSLVKQRYVFQWTNSQICIANRLRFKYFSTYLNEAKEQIKKQLAQSQAESDTLPPERQSDIAPTA